jgi:uncharacterized protein YdeI (BOF family)
MKKNSILQRASAFQMKRLLMVIIAFALSSSVAFAQDKMESKMGMEKGKKMGMMKDHVMMDGGKMMMMMDGKSMAMDKDMTMKNGTMVKMDGNVTMKNGKTMMMKDGDMMYMNGKMGKMKMNKSNKM